MASNIIIVISKAFIKTLDFYLYSSIHVAVSASFFILQTYILFDITIDQHYIFFIFSSTIFLYALHNVLGLYIHDNKVQRNKISTINKMRNILLPLIVITGISTLYCFTQLNYSEIATLAIFAFISIWYVLPIFGNKKRLSDYPIIKIFMVALVWAAISTIIPLNDFTEGNTTKLLYFIEKFMYIFALVIPFDIRDIDFDKSRDIKTLPIVYGKTKSIILAILALLVSISSSIYLHYTSIYSDRQLISILIGYIISGIVIYYASRKKHDYYFTGVVDGLPILNLLIILLIENVV